MDHTTDMPLVAKKHDKGFTLVELLIVIVILGILATVTVFAVRGITDEAKDNTCANDFAAMETAVEAFGTLNGGALPDTEEAMVPSVLKQTSATIAYEKTGDSTYTLTGEGSCAGQDRTA